MQIDFQGKQNLNQIVFSVKLSYYLFVYKLFKTLSSQNCLLMTQTIASNTKSIVTANQLSENKLNSLNQLIIYCQVIVGANNEAIQHSSVKTQAASSIINNTSYLRVSLANNYICRLSYSRVSLISFICIQLLIVAFKRVLQIA
ncbi:hypothetical protein TTHERM_000808039 (macronuclear) [Tetrahymena thermophila SB210]|uniref:Uncharacterized protein n=1 Tax=Tetrahymena thermophila (strain SB210) TaxID=312017 RepID=W7XF68_TETTS|nr:hypothetical protein TTHERM_000808039 [Tetrahymena thermophila SB210]EWS75458.1 hypothetical protein TTHERM_000808039 [Tetrahymena thermophila SB210]|eukprot:XP_012652005.1 hypothetical protein TTHERM_000808039 [Tetrahymena thermophila SB210]